MDDQLISYGNGKEEEVLQKELNEIDDSFINTQLEVNVSKNISHSIQELNNQMTGINNNSSD